MKLATLKNGTRDGELVVVSRDLARCVAVPEIARTLQAALDDWERRAVARRDLGRARTPAACRTRSRSIRARAMAPLPRAYQWAGRLGLRQSRRARAPRPRRRDAAGILDRPADVPGRVRQHARRVRGHRARRRGLGHRLRGRGRGHHRRRADGHAAAEAGRCIRLLMLVNDVSLRNLIPAELAKGFGFLQSKPASGFLAGRGHARRAGRRLARRPGAPAARLAPERRALRPAERGRRHDVRFPDADRARRQDARARGRQHRRIGHGVEQGGRRPGPARGRGRRRLLVHRRAAHASRRSSRASRRRRSCGSATGSASRCTTRRAAPCSAPSTRRSAGRADPRRVTFPAGSAQRATGGRLRTLGGLAPHRPVPVRRAAGALRRVSRRFAPRLSACRMPVEQRIPGA